MWGCGLISVRVGHEFQGPQNNSKLCLKCFSVIYFGIIRWKNAAVFLLELHIRYLLLSLCEIWPLWPLYNLLQCGVKKKQISIFKRKCQKIKTWSPLYFKYGELHVFILSNFLLKIEICFFLTPLFLSTGSLFHSLLDFETLFLPEFSK